MAVPLSGTVARLREAVSMETKIPTDQVISLLRPITHEPQKCCFLFFWNFLTVLSQTWLERNLKPVVSSVEGKIKNQDPKEKNIHKNFSCFI